MIRLHVGRSNLPLAMTLCAVVFAVVGCEKPGNFEPRFRLNSQSENRDNFVEGAGEDEAEKKQIQFNIDSRQYMADALQAMFGTPDHPYVFRESGLDLRKIRMASGPAGGLPQAAQQAALKVMKDREAELKKLQPEQDTEAKKRAADLLTNLTTFAAGKGIADAKTPADLKDNEAAFREQYKAVFEAQAAADAKVAQTAGELADLDMQIKSFSVPQKGLYRQHCAHCHGTTGDGAGPTAAFLNPYPRDYRQGIFKFKATDRASRPSPSDLRRILIDGINDTAMPSFALLPPDEVEALIEYVKYLSIRGEAESSMKDRLFGDGKEMQPSRSELVKVALKPAVDSWKEAESQSISPKEAYQGGTDLAASVKAGQALFLGDKAKCFSCHGPTGLGDGRKKSEPLYDIWNKDKAKTAVDLAAAVEKGDDVEIKRLTNLLQSYNLPIQAQQPRNLRLGKYRFGRSPIDLYRRIFAGINGTEMPAGGAPGPLSEKEVWQLVDYVLSVPYELQHTAPSSHGGAHTATDAHEHKPIAETAKPDQPAGK